MLIRIQKYNKELSYDKIFAYPLVCVLVGLEHVVL